MEFLEDRILERNKLLVESRKENIMLIDEHGSTKSIYLDAENDVIFNWLAFPGYEGRVQGKHDFVDNKFHFIEVP